ncbi:glycosyltransferase family 2 protein [Candidatus Daviesbacteria bacterium]|nr:glycosyltransferase family 2 protein [Candidatus Daviesbacteria bacterium]
MSKVFVIVLNFNLKKDILDCLSSLNKLSVVSCQLSVVVVDNASADGSPQAIKEQFPKVALIENKQNLGFSGGNNVGIKYALEQGADFVLILNPDTVVDENLVDELQAATRRHHKVGIFGPKIYFYIPDIQIWYAGGQLDWDNILASHVGVDQIDKGQFSKEQATDFVSGAAMFVRREVFDKVGLFDERYFLYYEDSDLCIRAQQAGFDLIFTPRAFLWHKNAAATGLGSPLQDYYITRNRLLFAQKFARFRARFALFRESLKFLFGTNSTKRRAVVDYYLGRFGKGI